MKALISSVEPVESGYRVAQVATDDMTFVVADGLFWVDCADNIVADKFYFDPVIQQITLVPVNIFVIPPPTKPQPISTGTVTL
jgi:hypothetical protein